MAGFLFALLFLAMVGHSSAAWCACKGLSDAALQKTLDYACGAGADCNPIHTNGPCFNPNTVRAHCNYAVNSYFQKKGQTSTACDFAGTATVTATDPSTAGCAYPVSASATPTTPGTTSPTTKTPSTSTATTGGSPYVTNTGILGGVNNGLGPSGAGMNTDISHAGISLQNASLFSFITIIISALALI
ncbi:PLASMODESMATA CALLOSE-BINDING PROTEIN 3-like [Nicotiana sylvestris]|uniref:PLASMODESMATA CALLOSE-BINDING PROTEIN 3 n=1 Tax=Nicotiana tabacum TaxID=4097 RepID=A0A1S3Y726_TOBAC|nr:PREDICTED: PLASMODESMATA CALLOSE-BINDING PROTEIN 3-like [Nicotiana tabacum]